jgi:hypothetical protein
MHHTGSNAENQAGAWDQGDGQGISGAWEFDMVAMLENSSRLRIGPDTHDERRMFQRTAADYEVKARRLDHTLRARLQPMLSVKLNDLSAGGLSGTCETPLEAGEHIAVAFPSNWPHAAWDAFGRVVRCLPMGNGYKVALAFDPLPAA